MEITPVNIIKDLGLSTRLVVYLNGFLETELREAWLKAKECDDPDKAKEVFLNSLKHS